MKKTSFRDEDEFGGYASLGNCNVIAATIGGSIVSGVMGSNASKSAADTQAGAARDASATSLAATRETNKLNWDIYQQNLANQSPYLVSGGKALSALSGGMGLGASRATQVAEGGTNYGANQAELDAAASPYSANGGQFTQTFKPSDLTTDPSYQWRLDQGNKALSASAAARGTLGTGQNLKDITDYSQGAASQEYGAAYNRFTDRQNTLYNRLAGLAGIGQTANTASAAAGAAAGQNIGSNTMAGVGASNQFLTGGANAQAAGTMGGANAWTGAINNGLNSWATLQGRNAGQNSDVGNMAQYNVSDTPDASWVKYN